MAIANQKGGVGKTTTTVNLGVALAELGHRVLVVDLDPQGNATTGLGIDARNFELSMYDVLMHGAALEDCIEPTNSVEHLFQRPHRHRSLRCGDRAGGGLQPEVEAQESGGCHCRGVYFEYVLIDCPPSLGLITVNGLAAATEAPAPHPVRSTSA